MPHEMFADAVVRPISPRARRRRRLLTLCSIGLHVVIVVPIASLQLLSPGPLPTTSRPMVFQIPDIVRLIDIPIAAAPRSNRDAGPPSEPANPVAPMLSPDGIPDEPSQPVRAGSENGVPGAPPGGVPYGIGAPLPGADAVPGPPPPSPAPPQPIRLHSGMQAPRKIVDVQPVYPPLAVASRREGIVILEAILDAQGNVTSLRALRSDPLLDQAAVDAVRRWKYTPALLNGVPVPVIMTITVRFSLH
jgi:protein TonB